MKPIWKPVLSVAVLALGALPALAQPVISAKSGVVSYVIGKVMVGDQEIKPSETKLTEVKENAVLRTEDGRAEVLLTLGTILRTGENSSFKMLTNRLIDTATAQVDKFDKEATDALDNWAKRRAELVAMANASSAKQVHDSGCGPNTNVVNSNFAAVNNGTTTTTSPCYNPCNSWRYNPWYGLITYIPCGANIYSPYGYRYWSPYNVMQAFYMPPPMFRGGGSGGGRMGGVGAYSGMSQTSAGYSGAMSAPSSSVSSSTAAVSSGTSVSSSAGSASSGHGASGGGGGHK